MCFILNEANNKRENKHQTQKLRFHFDWQDHWVTAKDAEKSAKDIMHMSAGRTMSIHSYFNDLSLYRWLSANKDCASVDLAKVVCYHNDLFVLGLQAIYRATYSSGESREIAADKHVCASGFHQTMGGVLQVATLELASNEFIRDVRTGQGEIVDQLTFVTNQREVSFGGTGGMAEPSQGSRLFQVGVTSRVIAFAGTKAGGLERLGYFVEPVNWEAIKHVVLTRALVEGQRAHSDESSRRNWNRKETIVNALLTQANDDIFRTVLSHLIYTTTTEDYANSTDLQCVR